jgi:hypothetical protein
LAKNDLICPLLNRFIATFYRGSTDVNGVCGSSCEAKTGVDTVGVYEYDTVTDSVVTTHVMKEGFGGDPYPSPDGSESIHSC